MKDMLGVTVEEGDIVLSCAATPHGAARLGRVYGFNKNGYPMVQYIGDAWDSKSGGYITKWRKGEAGSHVLVLGREALAEIAPTPELWNRIRMDYDGEIK